MCDCFKTTNDALAEHNTKMSPLIAWNQKTGVYLAGVTIQMEKIDKKKRQGPVHILATFCPFCGERQDVESA